MISEDLAEQILLSPHFVRLVSDLVDRSILDDLSAIERQIGSSGTDWNYGLLCASALTSIDSEIAQEAVLRVAQGCLSSDEANEAQKIAATLLLERTGNRPAISLAETRELVESSAWEAAPVPLQLDVVRRRLELSIPLASGTSVPGNRFQREFWTAALNNRWLSLSAPTSAGKSYIVKRWFEDRLATASHFCGVYIVPTRALIEEVGNDLRGHFPSEVSVISLPWDARIGASSKELFILTQERLHLLQQRLLGFAADLLFIDEAQKFGDDSRGVLLQRVLDEAVRRNPGTQVVFASPMANNPEVLLGGAPTGSSVAALTSEVITVNQNLLWVNQIRGYPTRWAVEVVTGEGNRPIGVVTLDARPSPESKRLPFLAVALGRETSGNVVYVNGPASAETTAMQIYEGLGSAHDISSDPKISALRELVEKTIHSRYSLTTVLQRGVAFHYGNMPLIIRAEIERLFRAGVLQYLICTSTLLEGVNLPCQNLFVRGPKKGNSAHMSAADFWNLAGRAGRWGKEFAGNIICVDTARETQWPSPPRQRARQPLTRSTDSVFQDLETLNRYIQAGTPVSDGRAAPVVESVFSLLATRVAEGQSIATVTGITSLSTSELRNLEGRLRATVDAIEIPSQIISLHAGISPLSMQRLLDYFRSKDDWSELVIDPPESANATQTYVQAIGRTSKYLGGKFGVPGGRHWMLALLIVNWMRGYPLARIIAERIRYLENSDREYRLPQVIRETMADVEQVARFEAPKFLSCYVDILRLYLNEIGQTEPMAGLPDLSLLLELGVSRTTEFSLMTLGLSRTSAIALSVYIVEDELSPEGALDWIRNRDLDALDLPALVRDEILRMLANY